MDNEVTLPGLRRARRDFAMFALGPGGSDGALKSEKFMVLCDERADAILKVRSSGAFQAAQKNS